MTEDEARMRVILSMCPDRVCRTCGEPSRRISEQSAEYLELRRQIVAGDPASYSGREQHVRPNGFGFGGGASSKIANGKVTANRTTTGWTDCGHDDWRPGVVLDPFAEVSE